MTDNNQIRDDEEVTKLGHLLQKNRTTYNLTTSNKTLRDTASHSVYDTIR